MHKRITTFRGDRLKQIRERKGLSQADVAGALDLGANTISRYEKGKSAPLDDNIVKLANYFNVSVDWFLGLTDDPTGALERTDMTPAEHKLLAAYRRGDLRVAMEILLQKSPG